MKTETKSFCRRLQSMLSVDFRRMFTMPLFYIMMGISVVMPILLLVMTTMLDGTVTVDPNTGAVSTIEALKSVWQAIGTVSGTGSATMDLTSMCNINLIYFLAAVLICIFVSEDFRSGYAKNLFTVRAKKTDYIISKTLVGFVCGAFMILGFFGGAMLGGAISGLPFEMAGFDTSGLIMCLLSKIFAVAIFIPVYVLLSVVAKQKMWVSLIGSLFIGMLFFMVIPMLTPLNSGIMNVIICLIGGVLFSVGIGVLSSRVLNKRDLL